MRGFAISTRLLARSLAPRYLHGENNQSPALIEFEVAQAGSDEFRTIVGPLELEHRAGDHLFDLPKIAAGCDRVRYRVLTNRGGSGCVTSKLFVFAARK